MKFKLIALAAAAAVLTGCATGPSDYQVYSETQKSIAQARAMAETARITALSEIAKNGDSAAKVAAVMSLQFAAQNQQNQSQLAAPTSTGDTLLKWTSVLLPSLTQFYAIGKSTDVAITHSNNSVITQQSNNDMVVDLVKGRKEPIVGNSTDVLLYPK